MKKSASTLHVVLDPEDEVITNVRKRPELLFSEHPRICRTFNCNGVRI